MLIFPQHLREHDEKITSHIVEVSHYLTSLCPVVGQIGGRAKRACVFLVRMTVPTGNPLAQGVRTRKYRCADEMVLVTLMTELVGWAVMLVRTVQFVESSVSRDSTA